MIGTNHGGNDTGDGLLSLAERCEASAGPDRELDGLIEVARDPTRQTILYNKPGRFPQETVRGPISKLKLTGRDLAEYISAPAYTASLDAAMSLVPEGWRIGRLSEVIESEMVEGVNNGPWVAQLSERHELQGRKIVSCERGATPALALCAAALRARAA